MKKSRGNGGKDMKTVALIIAPALIGAALAQMPAATVQVERATQGRDLLMRRSIGHAEAIKTVKVRTAVEGFLHEIVAKEGSMVEKGDVLYRIYPLRDMGYDPYVMVYDKPNAPKEIKRLQRWCNNRRIFKKTLRFEDYEG